MNKVISQGAEAIITKTGKTVIKERTKKSYRIPEIDKRLREQRTRKEAKLLIQSSKFIPVPKLINLSEKDSKLEIEFINGKKLSDNLNKIKNYKEVCENIGKNIAKLHNEGIIHGDLTTSNMILKDNEVYFIDFGLGFNSHKTEDKAVDLHLIKQALQAKHFAKFKEFFNCITDGYKSVSNKPNEILKQLNKVELRGRYKQAG